MISRIVLLLGMEEVLLTYCHFQPPDCSGESVELLCRAPQSSKYL